MGEISETYSGGTPKVSIKSFYNKKEIPFIRSSDIHKNTTELYITKEGLEESSAKLVSKGQILYALYGATSGEVDISKIDGAINQAILAINTHDNINYFIMLFLNKNKDKIIKKYIQGGQGNLSAKIVKNININITSKKEEKEISTFIKKFEKIFTLYERKLKLVKLICKELENKVYNNDLIKQTNFTKVKLGEILKEKNIKSTYEDQYPVLSSTNSGIELRNGRTNSSSNVGYKVLSKNELVLSPQNLWLGNININFDFENGLVSPSYKVFILTNNINIIYLNSLLHHPKMMYLYKVVSVQGASIVRRNLDIEAFENLTLKVPSIEAQNKIGNLLGKNRQLIDNLENKKEQISKIKTTLLNTMFI